MAISLFEASFLSNSQESQADQAKGNRTCRQPQYDTPSHHTPCSAASHHVRLPASPSVAGGGLKNGHRLLNAASERWRTIASTERSVSYRRCCDSPNQRTEIDIVSVRNQCKEFGGGRGGRGVSFCALEWGWRTVKERKTYEYIPLGPLQIPSTRQPCALVCLDSLHPSWPRKLGRVGQRGRLGRCELGGHAQAVVEEDAPVRPGRYSFEDHNQKREWRGKRRSGGCQKWVEEGLRGKIEEVRGTPRSKGIRDSQTMSSNTAAHPPSAGTVPVWRASSRDRAEDRFRRTARRARGGGTKPRRSRRLQLSLS